MPKQTLSADAARSALLAGVNAVADPVKITLGPRGRNVLLDRPNQPLATRDGVTVAKEVSNLPDPFENMGAAYAREVADATVVESGDGTTTATVILQAIVCGGFKLVSAGAEPLLLADGIESAAKACAEHIKKLAIKATPDLVRQAAIISTHGDVELGTLIAEATCKVGATGALELLESRDEKTSVEHLEGFYFKRGWAPHQFFTNDPTGRKCVLNKPYILISERMIVGANPKLDGDHLCKIAQQVAEKRRPFLIIAEDLQGDAMNFFAANIQHGGLVGGCFVKLPGMGDQKLASIEDLRVAVGASRIHSQTSTRIDDQLSSFVIDDLGWCEQAIVSAGQTVLVGGGANEMVKAKRVKQLMDQARDAENPYEKATLDARIARLTSGVMMLRVGGESEPAMLEKKARAEDAIHACRGAIEEGVVPGGGVALLRAAMANRAIRLVIANGGKMPNDPPDFCKGRDLLLDAITEPARQIIRNTGHQRADEIVDKILHQQGDWGYDAAEGRLRNLYEAGIVDPAKVVLVALRKAASIGALLLTTEVLVTDIPIDKKNT